MERKKYTVIYELDEGDGQSSQQAHRMAEGDGPGDYAGTVQLCHDMDGDVSAQNYPDAVERELSRPFERFPKKIM